MSKDSRDTDQFVTIQPAALNLGGNDDSRPEPFFSGERTNLFYLAIGALVILAGVWVFVFLPNNIGTPVNTSTASESTGEIAGSGNQQTKSAEAGNSGETPAPFELLDAARARKNAESTLAEFVQLQILLEDAMQVKQWAAEDYSSIIAIANEGDVLFLEAKYGDSMLKYTEGSTALRALVASGELLFSNAMKNAISALDKLDHQLAYQAFLEAAVIHPENPDVIDGMARASALPEVLSLIKEAGRLVLKQQYDQARLAYKRAQTIDPQMPGIDASLEDLEQRIQERNFRKYLSEAYAALNAQKYQKAENSFNQAARIKPDHASISDGLRQLERARLLRAIAGIKNQAESQILAEQWSLLPDTYTAALKLDANLQFARDGIVLAKKRARIDKVLQQIIANPGKLSSDPVYESALAVFNDALALEHQGPRLLAQLEKTKAILENAAVPVVIQITSDNLTEVGIVRRGSIGVFKTKTLELRPGSYIFTGSRPGCRDLRKEVEIARGMGSIAVQCEESI